MKWVVLAASVAMYALLIMFQNRKVWFTTAAAALMVGLSLAWPGAVFATTGGKALLAHLAGEVINWNVLGIYIGSMVIAALFIYSNVPARFAEGIVNSSRNTGLAIVAILAMTGLISVFVENVATVLVMAPIALALCRTLRLNPTFFMMGLAMMSNLEGTATLVGDPPSMIFASYAGYTFNDFFFHGGRISIFFIIQMGMLVGCVFFYCFFARAGRERVRVGHEEVVSWVPFWLLVAMVAGLAGLSFAQLPEGVLKTYGAGLFVLGLGVVGVAWYWVGQRKGHKATAVMVRELDWETIFFLLGIFVVIGAIDETGLLGDLARGLSVLTGGSKGVAFAVVLAVSIVISGFVDNVPYIMAMLPVAGQMAAGLGVERELLLFALLVGSCLGGNLTPFGASANVVAMGILRREGHPMEVSGWLKIGVPFTLLTTAAAAALLGGVWG